MPWLLFVGLAAAYVLRRKRAASTIAPDSDPTPTATTGTAAAFAGISTMSDASESSASYTNSSGASVTDWKADYGTPNEWDRKYPTSDPKKPLTVNFDDFDPEFRAKLEAAIAAMELQGYDPRVFEAARTQRRQAYLYGQGRTTFPGYGREGSKVTWTLDSSYHGKFPARAADVISRSTGWSDPKFFTAWGAAAKAAGLTWGGDWKSKDLPHVQL
jgi:hypothetical protein